MEILAGIIVVGLILYGFVSMADTAKNEGIGAVIGGIVVIILVCLFG